MSDVQYARTDDRSTVGVLTELVRQLSYHVEDDPDLELTRVSLQLAKTPILARDLTPDLATCSLFGVPDRRSPALSGGHRPGRAAPLDRRRLLARDQRDDEEHSMHRQYYTPSLPPARDHVTRVPKAAPLDIKRDTRT